PQPPCSTLFPYTTLFRSGFLPVQQAAGSEEQSKGLGGSGLRNDRRIYGFHYGNYAACTVRGCRWFPVRTAKEKLGRSDPQHSCMCAESDFCGSVSGYQINYDAGRDMLPVKEERKLERSIGYGGTVVSVLCRHWILPCTVSDLSDLDSPGS